MCDFANIGNYATTGWNLASTGLAVTNQLYRGIQQARVNSANNAAVSAGYQAQLNQLGVQQQQINQQSAQQQSEIAREAIKQRATLMTSAGEYGVAGHTLDALNYELTMNSNFARTNAETNRQNRIQQTGVAAEAMRAQAQSQMRPEGVNWLGLGLQIAGTAVDGFSKMKERFPNG